MSWLTAYLRRRAVVQMESAQATMETAEVLPPLHRAGFPVVVCWSAKAGCTTVLKWFLHHTGLLDAALAYDPWPHHYRSRVLTDPLTDYVAACKAALRSGDATVVKVVRDPARRAVSSYIHLLRDPTWDPGVHAWKQRVGLGRQPGLSFEQFLHFVINTRSTGQRLDVHFQSQWQPTWDGFVDRVIPLERLADELAAIEDQCGLPRTDLRRLSVSKHHNPPDIRHRWPRDAARFAATNAQLAALGTPPAEALLDDRTAELVRSAYADDYAAYGWLYAAPQPAAARHAA